VLIAIDATDLVIGVLRVTTGAVFILHGWNHAYGGGRIAGTARWFESLGMRPGRMHAWVATLVELAAGVLLVLGLLTPIVAGALLAAMTVAFVTNHMGNGFFSFRPGEGYEYVLVLGVVLVCLGGVGGGGLTLDQALGVFGAGWISVALTVVLGIGGGLTELLLFWRPHAPVADRAGQLLDDSLG
jgi:putative oxidoreductase